MLAAVAAPLFADGWLFTSFRGNGDTGVHFAVSRDGRTWTSLRGDQPWIKPEHSGMLMRDPHLSKGPDGIWRMVWTWGWTRKESSGALQMGYASSPDLVNWSKQEAIRVFENEPTARNVWAPESVWDASRKEWLIFWSTTIRGRFPDTEGTGDSGYNHRLYSITTKDWKTFTAPRLWFDPGFNSIDATLTKDGSRWVMAFKDERRNPLMKRLRLAFADAPAGPWRDISGPFTVDWVEGPSVARIGEEWWIYFDHYSRPQYYGAVRTRDWKSFEDVSSQIKLPPGHRHGTIVPLNEDEYTRLASATRP